MKARRAEERWERVMDAFCGALEYAEGRERELYLAAEIGDDAALLSEVTAMLRAHESLAPLEVEERLLNAGSAAPDLSGSRIGNYRLVRLIATGGMGEVYAAEREGAPFRQEVALKVLRQGLAGPESALRFRQERQILARLAHPHIVPLLDGGVCEDGRPYLVLQYVQGEAVTAYCERMNCGIEERMRLLRDIARAVEFAHKNLVVHRDLKPSNVLVTTDGEVRLLDFGVAKLLEDREDNDALVTRVESRILTPEYAAPEQVSGGAITVATDVYGLGALMYELLTGRRRIVEETPPLPSAASRDRMGDAWSKRLRGDPDTIILTAMAKEPERRYASAGDFAGDLERYLARRPILARKPSLRYQLAKFAGRNRVATAVTAVSLLLVIGLAGAVWQQSARVVRERDAARVEQQRADRVVSLLVDLFSSANPEYLPGGSDVTLGEFLEKAERTVMEQHGVEAGVQARLHHTLGKVLLARSQFPRARTHLEAALAEFRGGAARDEQAAAAVLHDLARLVLESGTNAEAVSMLRQSLERRRRLYGADHLLVAQCMQDLGRALTEPNERRAMLEGALAMRRRLLPGPHIEVADSLDALGTFHYEQGDIDLAGREFEEALGILRQAAPEGHPSTLLVMNDLSVVMQERARYSESEAVERTLLRDKIRFIGTETVPVAVSWGNLGAVLAFSGKHGESEEAFRKAHALFVKLLGPVHWQVANAARNLARIRLLRGDPGESARWFREAIEVQGKAVNAGADYWFMRGQAAVATFRIGQRAQAIEELRLVLENLAKFGATPLRASDARVALGFALMESGGVVEAEALFRDALDPRQRGIAAGHPAIAEAECALGAALAVQGKPEGRTMIARSWPRYRDWGLADPVYSGKAGRWFSPAQNR